MGTVSTSLVDIDAFVAKWALDERAEASLRGADAETQQRLITSFAPKDLSRGSSVALMGFLKHVRTKVAEEQEGKRQALLARIQTFVDMWQLHHKAQEILCTL